MENPEMNGAEQAPQAEPGEMEQAALQPIPLNNIGQLVGLLVGWHKNRMAQLNAAMNVPNDIEVEVTDHMTGEVFTLSQDQLVGFRAGISVVKSLFENLPIVVEFEDAGNDKDLPEAEASNDQSV